MDRKQLIKKYLKFFESKGHKIIPNASLIPKDDPTVLFTTAGMHPLTPYLLGQKHPLGKRLVNVQRCIRTTDIEEVGDASHHTFFEMLGNWSLGDYWKKQAIEMSFEFLTKNLKIPKEKLAITIFAGDDKAPRDEEARKIWKELGMQKIILLTKNTDDNWWGPAGKTGPCGPDTEIFYNKSSSDKLDVRTFNEEWVEIWNNVFMQYEKDAKGNCNPAKQKNIDTGMGVERTVTILNGLDDNYLSETFLPIIKQIEKLYGKEYPKNTRGRTILALDESYKDYEKEMIKPMRIIADHIKAAVFIIADGITPSNTEQGYVLRRLIRRAIVHGRALGLENFTDKVALPVFKIYDDYTELKKNKKKIIGELQKEEKKFLKTLDKGIKVLKKKSDSLNFTKDLFPGKTAFLLYQSYGFPIEMTKEILRAEGVDLDKKGFQEELKKHQKLSRTASAGKFKSGLADQSEKTTKLHAVTHLLNEALRKVLDKNIKQRGSNITSERLRFDFNFPRKLTEQEIKQVEDLVNKKIKEGLKVTSEEMPLKKALALGIQSEFNARYPDTVSVYSIGNFSKEICTGPHVKNTKEIGKFKILKEESSAAGIRRLKAVVK